MTIFLARFEQLYRGLPAETESICERIAAETGADPEAVKDEVYTERYNDYETELPDSDSVEAEDFDY